MALHGLRLRGTAADIGALRALADAAPALRDASWTELTAPSRAGSLLVCAGLDAATAAKARSRGADVVRVMIEDDIATARPLRSGGLSDLGEAWAPVTSRSAPTLVEALRPVRAHGDPVVDEAIFVVPREGEAAHRTLERLMTMGRDDVSVAQVTGDDGEELLVRVTHPPMYLLMRAREEPSEGVRAYARHGDAPLWVRWGYEHPLGSLARAPLSSAGRFALVDVDGRWRLAPADLPFASIYDVLEPRFEARRASLAHAPGELRFRVSLRLGPGPVADPELWLLTAEQFLALEPLVEAITPEDVGRFTVARTTGAEGTVYVLQELLRPNVPRMGTRVSDLAGAQGFVRMAGTDNLYLPPGRRLTPSMRRDEMRRLLDLDQHRAVVITEDGDGPRVVSVDVEAAAEVPLTRWVDYVATDRRMELERLDEGSIFDWPELEVMKPPKASASEGVEEPEKVRAPRQPREPRKAREETPDWGARGGDAESTETAEMRAEARALELALAAGGVDDPAPWLRLSELKRTLNEPEDSALCGEAGIFYGVGASEALALASRLAASRVRLGGRGATIDELTEIATAAAPTPFDASLLGARVLEMTLREGDAVDEGFLQQCVARFSEPTFPVSRRLAWAVLRGVLGRSGDKLGLTRAKERVLGGVNERGLSEAVDMPRFVRYALALAADGEVSDEAAQRAEQIASLEELWGVAQRRHVRELDAKSAYVRLAFAAGFMRLGSPGRARELVEPVEKEAGVHEPPNRVLFQLYQARMAHLATQGDAESWKREVEGALAAVKEPRVRDYVLPLVKRSSWLRATDRVDSAHAVRPSLQRELAAAESAGGGALIDTLRSLASRRDALFDYEVLIGIQRLLLASTRAGDDATLGDALMLAVSLANRRITIPGHRAQALSHCIRAGAALGDADLIDGLLGDVASLVQSTTQLQVTDLIDVTTSAISALRRFGASASALRFLESLVPMSQRVALGGTRIEATIAEGFLRLKDVDRADALIESAITTTLDRDVLEHVMRFETGADILRSLRHWPLHARLPRVRRFAEGLDRFGDAYTARKYYETFKVLILEGVIDTVADRVTWQGDRVQGWLDEEEQAIRRRIIDDWRDRCGA